MKKVLASSVVVLMVLFLSAGLGMARNGGGGPGGAGGGIAAGGGSCGLTGVSLVCDVTSSEPSVLVTFSGTVSTVASIGSGLSVDDLDLGVIDIYGIGPYWFWDAAEVVRPDVGDKVSGNAMEVTFSDGTSRIIAMDITVNGVNLILRVPCDNTDPDLVAGMPYWSGGRGGNN